MKVKVDLEICCSYGVCIENVPQVFSFGQDNLLSIVDIIPAELEEKVRFACELCPSQALEVIE